MAVSGGGTAARPFWHRIPLGWVLVGLLMVGGGALSGLLFGPTRSDTGEITKAGDLDPTDLRIGDCFDLKEPQGDEIGDVAVKPCTEAHEFETFFVGSMPEGTYPDELTVEEYVTKSCDPVFGTYVGKSFDRSVLAMTWFFPMADAWQEGDRSIQCMVHDPNAQRLTESLKGSRR